MAFSFERVNEGECPARRNQLQPELFELFEREVCVGEVILKTLIAEGQLVRVQPFPAPFP